jgi:dinuclear metal center YbgI/SA1388 family protein
MSVQLEELLQFLDNCLQPGRFQDYCPNGLQVEGRADVERLVTGVTASQALLEEAVAWGADAVLVHHGYFWKGERPEIVGIKRRRIAALINNDISLIAYHLPLDAHPELGNNARLGQLLGLGEPRPLLEDDAASVGNIADLQDPVPAAEIIARVAQLTRRAPLHIGPEDGLVTSIAWCTGAAQGYIESAVAAGADMFITGEVSEPTVHIAREEGIHFVAAGHHATERYGVQALGDYLAARLDLQHRFIDIDNPV